MCKGADSYMEDRGGVAAISGFPGVGLFIWACSRLLSEEPDFSPGDSLALPSAGSRHCQGPSNTSTQPLTHCSEQAPRSPSLNSGALPPTLTIIPHAGRMRFPMYSLIKFILKHLQRNLQEKKCKEPLLRTG